jgi:hypothetical protein
MVDGGEGTRCEDRRGVLRPSVNSRVAPSYRERRRSLMKEARSPPQQYSITM